MEETQRRLLSEAGKPDKVKQKQIFLRVVEEFRGKKLAPFPSRFSPYAEEWQQIIRLSAMPKALVSHLIHSEGLINEKKLVLTESSGASVHEVVSGWAGDDQSRVQYRETFFELFEKYIFRVLLYRFEIPSAIKRIVDQQLQGVTEISKIFPMEFGVRLFTFIPDLLTAASENLLVKGPDHEVIQSLVMFVNNHQSLLSYLEENIESILRAPQRAASLDEPVLESFGMDYIDRVVVDSDPSEVQAFTAERVHGNPLKVKKHKRKCSQPLRKDPANTAVAIAD